MSGNPLFVSIVLPAYNESQAISEVIGGIKRVMAKVPAYRYEIIVVDDASTDRTGEVAEKWRVRVIRHKVNRGSGAARKTGIRAAKGEVILMLDVDGTYPPADIPKLLNHFPACDQVIGSRRVEKGSFKLLRWGMKSLIKSLASYLTEVDIPDLNSGMRAFKKGVMQKYLWLLPDGFSCVSSMTMSFLTGGHPVKWVPIGYKSRVGVSKFHPLRDTSNYFLTVLRMVLVYNPLRIFMPVGFYLIFLATVKGLLTFYLYGEAMMLELILLIAGFFTITTGLLADLIVTLSKKGNEN